MRRRALALAIATVTLAVTSVVGSSSQAHAQDAEFRAKLRDPSGRVVGTVTFQVGEQATQVEAVLRPNRYVTPDAFHGFHLHANNDSSNGQGCRADPAQPSSTWFVAADGHLSETGQVHGAHDGDLPSPLVMADGTAWLAFSTHRIEPDVLRGTAVVLHAGPDNFGNVPQGSAPSQYTPNSPAATDLTHRTGNSGDRVACGLVRRARFWFS